MGARDRGEVAIRDALQRLGVADAVDAGGLRVLAGGMSGSVVCRFALDGRDVVLKRTVAGPRNAVMLARATREVRFYRELAGRVPVRVPAMIGSAIDPAEGTLLLLAACNPAPPPESWADAAYAEVARDLGRFHAAMRGVPLPAWMPSASAPTPGQRRDAAGRWRTLAETTGLVPDGLRRRMEETVARVAELDASIPGGPATLCHGDFHAGNLLHDANGGWVWADWQDLRIGPGVDDLAFLWERAFSAAEERLPPFDAMVEAYWAGLAEAGGPGMDRAAFARALAWSELRGWLIAWPPYLGYLSRAQQERVVARIAWLVERLNETA